MGDLLRKTLSNPLVFWLGFLVGSVFWWILGKLYPLLLIVPRKFFQSIVRQKEKVSISDETHLSNAMLQRAQSWHLAQALFSLDEIVVPPRIMLPPLSLESVENPFEIDITDTVIPYCPDFPELAAFYHAPTTTLKEALSERANLILMGHPGAGKSVALAHLTCDLIRSNQNEKGESWRLPLLLHATELTFPTENSESVTDVLIKAVRFSRPPIPEARLKKLIQALLISGKLLLLIDGLDELPKAEANPIIGFITEISNKFKGVQFVIATSLEYYGSLTSLKAFPVAIADWSEAQRERFVKVWINQWSQKIDPLYPKQSSPLDSRLIYGWLKNKVAFLSPLELTLTLWAATSGEILGNTIADAIEAYIRRATSHLPEKHRESLETVAAYMVVNGSGYLIPEMQTGTKAPISPRIDTPSGTFQAEGTESEFSLSRAFRKINLSSLCSHLTETGLLIERGEGKFCFCHASIAAYLAWEQIQQSARIEQILQQQPWTLATETLKYLAVSHPQPAWLRAYLTDETVNPTMRELFQVARWLPYTPVECEWGKQTLRRLASVLQNNDVAETVKARALTALIRLTEIGVDTLLRRFLASEKSPIRHLAALGCGVLKDKQSLPLLKNLLDDPSPQNQNAALLALTALGDQNALEAVAFKILHGDEMSKRYAAMALSNNTEEGFPTLEEASRHPNSAIRRAAIYGLFRLGTKQAQNLLFEMQLNDTEWLVQDSATQALERLQKGSSRLPKPLPPLHESSWLIRYASTHGIGVAPGKPAIELLQKLLRDGEEDQILSALGYLFSQATEELLLPLYQLYFSIRGEIQEWSFFALEHLQRCGVILPSPVQYGLQISSGA